MKELIEKVRIFFSAPSYTRTLALVGLLVLILALPVTVAFLGQQTQTKQSAHFADCPVIELKCGKDPDVATYCSNASSFVSTDQVHIDSTVNCGKTACGVTHNSTACGYICKNYTTPNVCRGQQLCDLNGNTCSTYTTYSNCRIEGGKCGAPLCGSSGIGGTCMYGGCTNGNNPNGGYCASTSQQCCKVPTPTQVPKTCAQAGGVCAYDCGAVGSRSPGGTCGTSGNMQCCNPSVTCGTGATAGASCQSASNGSCPNGFSFVGGGTCDTGQMCCKNTATATCDSQFYAPINTDCATEAKSIVPKCPNPQNYVFSNLEWNVLLGPGPFGFFVNVCKYHGSTAPKTITCGTDSYAGSKTFCSPGAYVNNEFACPSGSRLISDNRYYNPPAANYSGCSTYALCCGYTGTKPPEPTKSPETQCKSAGGQCYFNLSGCPTGSSNLGQKDCNAPTFCCKGIPLNSCSANGESGLCYTGNSCGSATHKIGGSCASGTVCCAAGGSSGCTSNCGGDGGGNGGGTPPPSCTNGKHTQFALNIKLPGIGSGDFENHTPAHATKHGSLIVKDGNGTQLFGVTHDFTHAFAHGNTNGPLASEKVDLGTTQVVCGKTYHVEVKLPGYVTIKKDVAYGQDQTLTITEADIIPGDIVGDTTNNFITPDGKIIGDDVINILDYNVMRDCRNADATAGKTFSNGSTTITIKCGDLINFYDFQDGGTQESVAMPPPSGIGEWDANYNVWLRGFIKAGGN